MPRTAFAFLRALCTFAVKFLLLVSLLAACGKGDVPVAPPPFSGPLTIIAPQSERAGEPLSVQVQASAPDETPAHLILTGSYGTLAYTLPMQNGEARFVLPSAETERSGLITLAARVGEAQAQAQINLEPGPPAEPLTPLVGSRTITADGGHWAMVVAIPFDDLGNPVSEGTPVQVRALHPGQRLELATVPVHHLLSWFELFSGTQAGRTTISVQAQDAFGPEATLMEVPGWPVPFPVLAAPQSMTGNGRLLMTLRTGLIRDRFGNEIPDGTIVTFVLENPAGKRRWVPGYTVDGVAEVTIQAADEAVSYQVWATIFGVAESQPATISFTDGPAVGAFPLTALFSPETGALYISAGPVLGPLKQYVPDGTPVRFEIRDSLGRVQVETSPTDAGYTTAEVRLISLDNGHYTVRASAGSGQGELRFHLEDLPLPTPEPDQEPSTTIPARRVVIEEASTSDGLQTSPGITPPLSATQTMTPVASPPVIPAAISPTPRSAPTRLSPSTATPTGVPTATPTATPTFTPTPVVLTGRVNIEIGLNVRAAPRLGAGLVATLGLGERVILVGRSADGFWLEILLDQPDGSTSAWVAAAFVDVDGGTDSLPVR